jgi:hypothetical protein
MGMNHSSAAKAAIHFSPFAARLKSCPFKTCCIATLWQEQGAALSKPRHALLHTISVVPFQNSILEVPVHT